MILEAINRAEKGKSKLSQAYIERLNGLSSPKIWHTLNNLAANSTAYLEVGTYMGSTLMAATCANTHLYTVAVDNFCMKPHTRNHFFHNVKHIDFKFIEDDCFSIDLKEIEKPIDLYFFDGEHTYEAQYNAIDYYLPAMADEFIFVVDDWTNAPVKNGTLDAIKKNNLQIIECQIRGEGKLKDKDGWWCGFASFKLKKP
jgi:predicted O-methyltransferase YrrM